MSKLIKLSIIALLWFSSFSVAVLSLRAAGLVPTPSGETSTAGCLGSSNCGNYTLNDMVGVVIIVSNFILGIVGSLALLAFIVGGLMWLLSGGKTELVEKGKQTIIGAAVGLVIVFTSYMIIQLVFDALGITMAAGGKWAVSDWFK